MDKALDLRVQKTYMALMASFSELLRKKRFEKITVNEICDNAMVRRATFYKHFADKYELFAFMVRDIIAAFNAKRNDLDGINSITYYGQIIEYLFDFLDENEELVQSISESDVLSTLLDILSEQIVLDLKASFRRDEKKGYQLIASPELMAQAFSGALISIAKWWVTKKKPTPKEDVIQYGMSLLQRLMTNAAKFDITNESL